MCVYSDQGHSFAADIWSLGAMFYVLLCGYHPFDAGDDEPHVIQERVRKGVYILAFIYMRIQMYSCRQLYVCT